MAIKGKSNNPDLGVIECDGCDAFAVIRRRANGKRLLYEHCPNCGMNQKSGAKLQAKWARAIAKEGGGQSPEIPSFKSEPVHKIESIETGEWLPEELIKEMERIQNETAKKGECNERINSEKNPISTSDGKPANGFGFFFFGAIAGVAAIAGLRR